MGPIEKAIEEFRAIRYRVYKTDPVQIVRDTHIAERATNDHIGRWFFELLQNSDDASASKVKVHVTDDAVYVADNGKGLTSESIKAICGTDFSEKITGTIGRKGVGFKAVYEVSKLPQVLTINGEGIEFCPQKTRNWLRDNNLGDQYVPYQWIPFFISRTKAEEQDSILKELTCYNTVVKLLFASADSIAEIKSQLEEWPPHALMAFRHVEVLDADPILRITVTRKKNAIWKINDSRGKVPEMWRVAQHSEKPHADILRSLSQEEQVRVKQDGVNFLVAAPFETDYIVPTKEYLPVHVFYPTEQKGPVRMFLHAEFLVKSDRTALIPIENNPFNQWVAERLGHHVCGFVQDTYSSEEPSRHLRLLLPFEDKDTHPVAAALWKHIAKKARAYLKVGNVKGNQRLKIAQAKLISVSVDAGRARRLLETTELGRYLSHETFDNDKEARKAIKALKCHEIHDQGMMKVIADYGTSKAADREWTWICWEWIAAWVAEKPHGDENKMRIEAAKGLPLVPVIGCLQRCANLVDHIVTWRDDEAPNNLPDWLPLTFLDDWFRDRVAVLTEDKSDPANSPVLNLLKNLEIKKPGNDVIQRAVVQAIGKYWEDNEGDPGRFLNYILQQDWYEIAEPAKDLQRCPVPAAYEGSEGIIWAEAGTVYFGGHWNNETLACLYMGNPNIPFVSLLDSAQSIEIQRAVLAWLGVVDFPRVIEDKIERYVGQMPQDCGDWKAHLQKSYDNYHGRAVEKVKSISRFDHITVKELDASRSTALVALVAINWDSYYRAKSEVMAYGAHARERRYRFWEIKAKWWYEVCQLLNLPLRKPLHAPLSECWLPDKHTDRSIGDLLPVANLDLYGKNREVVRKWLVDVAGLRTRIDQLTPDEWMEILSSRIPQAAPAEKIGSDELLRDRVVKWYEACLDTVSDNGEFPDNCFESCPVLCRKGDGWKYVKDQSRYVADDRLIAEAFAEDEWLVDLPSRLKGAAGKYFTICSLSQSVEELSEIPEVRQELSGDLRSNFQETLPYVFAWRLAQARQDERKLKKRLKSLPVWIVEELSVVLKLNNNSRQVERPYVIYKSEIFLCKADVGEPALAQALADALEVRSEADFYENLLRCKSNGERRSKLSAKGLTDADINPRLSEYSGDLPMEKVTITFEPTEKTEQKMEATPKDQPSTTTSQDTLAHGKPEEDTVNQGKQPSDHKSSEESRTSILLKDSQAEYEVDRTPKNILPVGDGDDGHRDPSPQASTALSKNQKQDLENLSKTFARRELEKQGYKVEEMSQENPGFDLRAKKDSKELRVELKAHLSRGTVIELTARQYKEYLGRDQGGYEWQLWNVEYLEQNQSTIRITPYSSIPDEALDSKTFRVDLKKCPL